MPKLTSLKVTGVLLFALTCGCSDELVETAQNAQPTPLNELPADTGKADGQSFRVKDYFKNTLNVSLDDLTDRVALLATDEMNDLLSSSPFADIELSPTLLFAATAGDTNGSTILDLAQLSEGLTAQYGDESLVSQVNSTRLNFLSSTPYRFYAESEFEVRGRIGGALDTAVDDFDVALGFEPSVTLTARTVFAHDSNFEAILRAPLQSAKELRGFVLPRNAEDLKSLLPGESIALSGKGTVGFNIGANLPIFSINPVDYLVLTSRFHIGAKVRTSGVLDIQYIRGDGNELLVDIGLSNAYDRRHRVAFESGYGLEGLPSLLKVSVGDQTFELGKIAETLIERRLERSGLLSYGIASVTNSSERRNSIQRFSIDLGRAGKEMDQALKQIAGGDLRLIQALADRANSGVTELVSFERQMEEKFKHLGAHIGGMRFFTENQDSSGRVVVHQGGRVDELLFSELETRRGRFFTDWGFRRVILTQQSWKNGVYEGALSNVRFAVSESDSYTDRDQVLDHVDSALLSVLPFDTAYKDLTRAFEELQHEVDEHCRDCTRDNDNLCERRYERCVAEYITDSELAAWQERLRTLTDAEVSRVSSQGYNTQYSDASKMAQQLLDLKLQLSSVKELPVALADVTGRTAILSDYRVSQQGLNQMFRSVSPEAFGQRLREVLTMIVSKRSKEYDTKYERATDWLDDRADLIDDMMNVYDRARKRFIQLDEASQVRVGDRRVGDGAFLITAGSDSVEEDEIAPTMLSIAEQKAIVSANMVEALVERGRELSLIQTLLRLVTLGLANPRSFESHHLIAYTLASLVDPAHREWLLSMDFEEAGFTDVKLYSRGLSDDGLINVGSFDLDALISR